MVEFVIFLIIIMAICIGMAASIRLLTFQFWAQQEARYLAFEQTWVVTEHDANSHQGALERSDNGAYFQRPKVAQDRDIYRGIEDKGSLSQLLARLFSPEKLDGASMLASNSFIEKAMAPVDPLNQIKQDLSFTDVAYAKEANIQSPLTAGVKVGSEIVQGKNERLHLAINSFFAKANLGKKVCAGIHRFSSERNLSYVLSYFEDSDCNEKVNLELSSRLANLDIPELIKDFDFQLKKGIPTNVALDRTISPQIVEQFFSLFREKVKTSRQDAPNQIQTFRNDINSAMGDSSIQQMIDRARYVGSASAVEAIKNAVNDISDIGVNERSRKDTLEIENSIIEVLHSEPDGSDQFDLASKYLPVPPSFGAAAGSMQEAVMNNLLAEDGATRDQQVENSNQQAKVTYQSRGGLFPAATKIPGIQDVELSSKFFLVTQPWHITRRDGAGSYREKGTQFDLADENSEEAVLRRRVLGLWVVPVAPQELLDPVLDFAGLGELKPAFDALMPISSMLSTVKKTITNNPFFDAAQSLSKIPVIGNLIPVPPIFPAVRPDAYPKSEEMTGNEPGSVDKLVDDNGREFKDYMDEQQYNPPPEPEYEDD